VTGLSLKNGRIIDPASGIDGLYDLIITDGKIRQLKPAGKLPPTPGQPVLDCSGLWVLPGLIDPHAHLREPGFSEKETIASGLRAAAAGGFTLVAAMANTLPANDKAEVAQYMLARARETGAAQLVPVAAVTKGLEGRELVDFDVMIQAGARMFSDDGVPIDDKAVLAAAFQEAYRTGFAISLHEEDRELSAGGVMNAGRLADLLGVMGIPASAEVRRIRRDLGLVTESRTPIHIAHVSTAEAIDLIRAAKKRLANLTCEVTPHHFTLDESAILTSGPDARMSPPLRTRADVEAAVKAMADGTVDMIATDHAPHDFWSKCWDELGHLFGPNTPARRLPEGKARALARAANGVVGLETAVGLAMALVHRGAISPARMVEMMALNPARLLRLTEHGRFVIGGPANVTVIDPELEWSVNPGDFISRSRNTPFTGMKLKGMPVTTIVGGEIVFSRLPNAGVQNVS
jgi:dihydroorotase